MHKRIARLVLALLSTAPLLAPIAPYPQAIPRPVEGSVLPALVDDDERVIGDLAPDGKVVALRDDIKLQVAGSGDFALLLPGRVESITEQGGDEVPGLQDGRISFMGHLTGRKLLAAEARLDPALYVPALPLRIDIHYFAGDREVDPRTAEGSGGDFREVISVHNLTGKPQAFVGGQPDRAALGQVLEALRGVPSVYTPETDLGSLYPLPTALPLTATSTSTLPLQTTFVPLTIDIDARLESGVNVGPVDGATVTRDERGTRVRWRVVLPADPAGGGDVTRSLPFHADQLRLPGLDFNINVVPLPATLFTPPGNGPWSDYLATAGPDTLEQLSLKAQAGAASLHRIADLPPPVNRPGPGPEKVSYQLVLDSGQRPVALPAPAVPGPQPWAWALLALGAVVVGANAWWAWSRN
jgi:hypothetical protein